MFEDRDNLHDDVIEREASTAKLVSPTEGDSSFIGATIANQYKITSVLGAGGMSTVYRADDLLLDRQVAIKVLHSRSRMNPQSIRRFQQEGKALSQLDHENIVRIYHLGIHEETIPFMVMQLLNGVPLSEVLQQSALDVKTSLVIMDQLCDALQQAHDLGIVHRDLKRSNILVTNRNRFEVKIIDFGIARMLSQSNLQQLTTAGEIFGSPLYMSPEQCAGQTIDQRSDIYSLGCIFYECLTGLPPHMGETPLATMFKHQQEAPLPLRQSSLGKEFPEELERMVQRMLEKQPDKRYPNVSELQTDIAKLQTASRVENAPRAIGTGVALSRQRNLPTISPHILAGAILVLSLVAVFIVIRFIMQDQPTQPPISTSGRSFQQLPPTAVESAVETSRVQRDIFDAKSEGTQVLVCKSYFTDKDLLAVGELPIRCLDLSNCRVGGPGLEALKDSSSLLELRLHNCDRIKNEDLKFLNPNLRDLSLNDFRRITLLNASNLHLPKLHRLSIEGTKVGDVSLDFLSTQKGLKYLNIMGSEFLTLDAQRRFLERLPRCVLKTTPLTLENLLLEFSAPSRDRAISIEAHGVVRDWSSLKQFHHMEYLDLGSSNFSDADIHFLNKSSLRAINLFMCHTLTPGGWRKILSMPNLLEVDAESSSITDDDLKYSNPNIVQLVLSRCAISAKGIENLEQQKNLTVLKIDHNEALDDSVFAMLKKMPTLEHLDIRDCPHLTQESIRKFAEFNRHCIVFYD